MSIVFNFYSVAFESFESSVESLLSLVVCEGIPKHEKKIPWKSISGCCN